MRPASDLMSAFGIRPGDFGTKSPRPDPCRVLGYLSAKEYLSVLRSTNAHRNTAVDAVGRGAVDASAGKKLGCIRLPLGPFLDAMYHGGEERHPRMGPMAGRLEQIVSEWMGRLSR